jgi:hypothetical protein
MSYTNAIRKIHEATFGTLSAATADQRVFVVPKQVLPLLQKAGVTPPPPGETFDQGELSKTLSSAGVSIEERAMVKQSLAHCGLLRV